MLQNEYYSLRFFFVMKLYQSNNNIGETLIKNNYEKQQFKFKYN